MSNAVKEQPVGKHQPEPRSVGMVEVRARKTGDAGQALADAVLAVGEAAQRYGTGIMITEVGEGSFVVRAHPAVPFGLVREQRGAWQSR